MQSLYFILDTLLRTLFNLYLMVVILRIWLQWARADFYNPLSQFVVRCTHPILGPLRRLVPSVGGLDLAAVLLAYAVALAKYLVLMALGMIQAQWLGLLLVSLLLVLKQAGSLLFWLLVARAILSWVSQGRSPLELVLYQLTEPLLSPIRRVIPAIGGLDLSVLVVFLILNGLNLFISTSEWLGIIRVLWVSL